MCDPSPLLVLMKYGEMNPRSNLVPSMVSSSSWSVLPSLTVITPFLPTVFIAEEMREPISRSPLAEIVATLERGRGGGRGGRGRGRGGEGIREEIVHMTTHS